MFNDKHKADVAYRIQDSFLNLCFDPDQGIDGTKALMLLSGIYVETAYLFDNCEEALQASFTQLSHQLNCHAYRGGLSENTLPPSTIIDFDTEMGRAVARELFEEWLDCQYEFHDILIFMTHNLFVQFENQSGGRSQSRQESLRLLVEGTYRAIAYEIGAQELCDVIIEQKVGLKGWNMGDSIGSLAGLAGRKLSLSHGGRNQCCWFRGTDLPDLLDQTAYVMTQEAVRLGTPSGTDWRFGLPANDIPTNAPTQLVNSIENMCDGFFNAIQLYDYHDQSVCAAKAAGRLLAVVCGGDKPELEPSIAKPLAMAALTESYKSACVDHAAAAFV